MVVAFCDANGICMFCQWHRTSRLQMTWKKKSASTVFNNFNTAYSNSGNIIFVSHKLSVVLHYESRNLLSETLKKQNIDILYIWLKFCVCQLYLKCRMFQAATESYFIKLLSECVLHVLRVNVHVVSIGLSDTGSCYTKYTLKTCHFLHEGCLLLLQCRF